MTEEQLQIQVFQLTTALGFAIDYLEAGKLTSNDLDREVYVIEELKKTLVDHAGEIYADVHLAVWRHNLLNAVEAQANDETLWCLDTTVGEAYVTQSLRWLHQVIEKNDLEALKKIVDQSEDKI